MCMKLYCRLIIYSMISMSILSVSNWDIVNIFSCIKVLGVFNVKRFGTVSSY